MNVHVREAFITCASV